MDTSERMKQAVQGTASAVGKEMTGRGGEKPTAGTVDATIVENILAAWGDIPKKVARRTIDRYGLPNEATPSRLIWFENGPWKRTILYRDEVPHNFPKPHTDVLQFESRRDDTADVDEVTMTPIMRSTVEEVANAVRGKGSER